jgi:glycosyltransferase involved in cell wall biosynthesis
MSLEVVHVVPGLSPAEGGPSYSVPRLCQELAASGRIKPSLTSVAAAGDAPAVSSDFGYEISTFAWDAAELPVLSRLRLSRGLASGLKHAATEADLIHNHGLWLMPNLAAGWAAKKAKRPLVISPRGMLSPEALSFSSGKKRLMWWGVQGAIVSAAACLHATCEAEYREVRLAGLCNPVAIIPNGIDIPVLERGDCSKDDDLTILSLGRIHPKKGLKSLLAAWATVEPERPGWRLRIVGPDEGGHAEELRLLARSAGLVRVSIEPPVYGRDKISLYQSAHLFVLSSINENFGLTVAEALAFGVPVISTRGAPWAGLTSERCGWWVDSDIDSLARAIAEATFLPNATLREIGFRGRSWMQRDYSWSRVADEMARVYEWLVTGGRPPETVRTD